jgi:hypothetical protein
MTSFARMGILVEDERASLQRILKKFDQLTEKSIRAKTAAEGIGTGFTYTAAQIKTAAAQLQQFILLTRAAFRPGVGPFKAINVQLRAAIANAKLLRTILAAPYGALPAAYTQGYKELGQIRRQITGAPPPITDPRRLIEDTSARRAAQTAAAQRTTERFESRAPRPPVFTHPTTLIEDTRQRRAAAQYRRDTGMLGYQTRRANEQARYQEAIDRYTSRRPQHSLYGTNIPPRGQLRIEDTYAHRQRQASRFQNLAAGGYASTGQLPTPPPRRQPTAGLIEYKPHGMLPGGVSKFTAVQQAKGVAELGNAYGAASASAKEFYGVADDGSKRVISNAAASSAATKKSVAQTKSAVAAEEDGIPIKKQIASLDDKIAKQRKIVSAIDEKRSIAAQREMGAIVRGRQADADSMQRYGKVSEKLSRAQTEQEKVLGRMLGERAVLRDPTAASDVYAESQKKLNKEIEQGINSNKNHKNAVDANDKSQRRLTKTGKGLGKQQSFINSGFGKFSIIMSGIAATLFVWQVLSRAIRTIVGVGIDFETAFIRAADSLKLTTAELKNLESAAIDAGKTGVIKGPDYTELISQFVEFGYSIEDATARVNAAIEHEVELFEDTITGRLKRMGGLFTEIARQAFGASGYFGDTLEDANTQLEKIADAEGSLSTIGRIIEGLGRAILEYHDKLNPILNLWRAEFDLVYRQSGILDTAASAWKRLTEATKEFYVVTPSGNVFPQRSVPEIPTVPEAQQAVAEDFDTGYGDYYPSLGADVDAAANASAELDKNTKSTAENIKETQEAAKQLSKDLKTAAGFFGFMTKKIKETRLDNHKLEQTPRIRSTA